MSTPLRDLLCTNNIFLFSQHSVSTIEEPFSTVSGSMAEREACSNGPGDVRPASWSLWLPNPGHASRFVLEPCVEVRSRTLANSVLTLLLWEPLTIKVNKTPKILGIDLWCECRTPGLFSQPDCCHELGESTLIDELCESVGDVINAWKFVKFEIQCFSQGIGPTGRPRQGV